eukprot:scaffold153830_cov35-Tisochrysis_lutea.AAC.2
MAHISPCSLAVSYDCSARLTSRYDSYVARKCAGFSRTLYVGECVDADDDARRVIGPPHDAASGVGQIARAHRRLIKCEGCKPPASIAAPIGSGRIPLEGCQAALISVFGVMT